MNRIASLKREKYLEIVLASSNRGSLGRDDRTTSCVCMLLFRVACQPVNMSASLENIKMMAIGRQFNIGTLYNYVTDVTLPSKLNFFFNFSYFLFKFMCEKENSFDNSLCLYTSPFHL